MKFNANREKYTKCWKRRKKRTFNEIFDYEYLLSPDVCEEIIKYYFKETIGDGDWMTFQRAMNVIESHEFNKQKRDRLITALDTVRQNRSIPNAKESRTDEELTSFNQTFKDLVELDINPVTIPQSWMVVRAENLLRSYYNQLTSEQHWMSVLY